MSNVNTNENMSIGARVHDAMKSIYGSDYIRKWEHTDLGKLKSMWDFALQRLSEKEIQTGLAACITRKYVPNLPEFVEMCRPQLNPENAYHEAVNGLAERQKGLMGHWSNPAIYYAAITMHSEIMSGSYRQNKTRWDNALSAALSNPNHEPIPTPALQLENQHSTPASAEQMKKTMSLVANAVKPKTDPREWAQKILDNPKGKSMIAIRMARSVVNGGSGLND